jgi:hypothetical protein
MVEVRDGMDMLDRFSPQLSWLLFIGCTYLAYRSLTQANGGTSRRAYIWMSLPGTLLVLFQIVRVAPELYSLAMGGLLLPVSFVLLVWLALYGALNPGWWVSPIVIVANALGKPRPSDRNTWIGCCVLGGLWIWGRVFDNVFLPEISVG